MLVELREENRALIHPVHPLGPVGGRREPLAGWCSQDEPRALPERFGVVSFPHGV